MSQGMGQRRFERFNIFERAALIGEGGERTAVILVDASLGGAQVLAKDAYKEGKNVQLEVGHGDDKVCLNGHIRYNKPGEHDLIAVGFHFTPETPEERIHVANLINRIFMNPSELPAHPTTAISEWLGKSAA
jgi:hypothetical protein